MHAMVRTSETVSAADNPLRHTVNQAAKTHVGVAYELRTLTSCQDDDGARSFTYANDDSGEIFH